MVRFLALLVVLIPIGSAALGIKLMRDALFAQAVYVFDNLFLQFVLGALFFIFGLYIMGSFIFYRDKKRKKVAPRFMR